MSVYFFRACSKAERKASRERWLRMRRVTVAYKPVTGTRVISFKSFRARCGLFFCFRHHDPVCFLALFTTANALLRSPSPATSLCAPRHHFIHQTHLVRNSDSTSRCGHSGGISHLPGRAPKASGNHTTNQRTRTGNRVLASADRLVIIHRRG